MNEGVSMKNAISHHKTQTTAGVNMVVVSPLVWQV